MLFNIKCITSQYCIAIYYVSITNSYETFFRMEVCVFNYCMTIKTMCVTLKARRAEATELSPVRSVKK